MVVKKHIYAQNLHKNEIDTDCVIQRWMQKKILYKAMYSACFFRGVILIRQGPFLSLCYLWATLHIKYPDLFRATLLQSSNDIVGKIHHYFQL